MAILYPNFTGTPNWHLLQHLVTDFILDPQDGSGPVADLALWSYEALHQKSKGVNHNNRAPEFSILKFFAEQAYTSAMFNKADRAGFLSPQERELSGDIGILPSESHKLIFDGRNRPRLGAGKAVDVLYIDADDSIVDCVKGAAFGHGSRIFCYSYKFMNKYGFPPITGAERIDGGPCSGFVKRESLTDVKYGAYATGEKSVFTSLKIKLQKFYSQIALSLISQYWGIEEAACDPARIAVDDEILTFPKMRLGNDWISSLDGSRGANEENGRSDNPCYIATWFTPEHADVDEDSYLQVGRVHKFFVHRHAGRNHMLAFVEWYEQLGETVRTVQNHISDLIVTPAQKTAYRKDLEAFGLDMFDPDRTRSPKPVIKARDAEAYVDTASVNQLFMADTFWPGDDRYHVIPVHRIAYRVCPHFFKQTLKFKSSKRSGIVKPMIATLCERRIRS